MKAKLCEDISGFLCGINFVDNVKLPVQNPEHSHVGIFPRRNSFRPKLIEKQIVKPLKVELKSLMEDFIKLTFKQG